MTFFGEKKMNKEKLCQCGCGKCVLPASKTNKKRGLIKGQLANYLKGHSSRFKKKGLISFVVDKKTGCWIWQRSKTSMGYGNLRLNGKNILAHRYIYELVKGKISSNCEIDHLCQNHLCINPIHLEAVSHAENCYRGARAKLSRDKVDYAKQLRESGWLINQIAKKFKVERHTITSALNGRS